MGTQVFLSKGYLYGDYTLKKIKTKKDITNDVKFTNSDEHAQPNVFVTSMHSLMFS